MESYIQTLGIRAKNASRLCAKLGTKEKNRGLLAVAGELCARSTYLLEENEKDLRAAEEKGVKQSLIDRLRLTEQRIRDMAEGLKRRWRIPSGRC